MSEKRSPPLDGLPLFSRKPSTNESQPSTAVDAAKKPETPIHVIERKELPKVPKKVKNYIDTEHPTTSLSFPTDEEDDLATTSVPGMQHGFWAFYSLKETYTVSKPEGDATLFEMLDGKIFIYPGVISNGNLINHGKIEVYRVLPDKVKNCLRWFKKQSQK